MPGQPSQEEALKLPPIEPRRRYVDNLVARGVALGGGSVMLAIALIFLYLVWVVLPIFVPAKIEGGKLVPLPAVSAKLVDVDESTTLGMRILDRGQVEFFDLGTGAIISTVPLPQPVARAQPLDDELSTYVVTFADGSLCVLEVAYQVSFRNGIRTLTPELQFPFTSQALPGIALETERDHFLLLREEDGLFATLTATGVDIVPIEEPVAGTPLQRRPAASIILDGDLWRLFSGPDGQWIYVLGRDGRLRIVSLAQPRQPRLSFDGRLLGGNKRVTTATTLPGDYSLLLGDDGRHISQWYPVQGETGTEMVAPRRFELEAVPVAVETEPRRKGFVVLDGHGQLTLFHSTSERQLARTRVPDRAGASQIADLTMAPRADQLLLTADSGAIYRYGIRNEHPELSLRTLWGKVWYEGYDAPRYSWQSSAADNEFEPKFSLVPLAFGTLKAAFYALLVAVPLAIMGAIYTAYFMAPAMRRIVKPGIEIMAALPTVVLGFVAGLWLAPLVEARLMAVLVFLPLAVAAVLITSIAVARLPAPLPERLKGWYGLLLLPVLLLCLPLSGALGELLEAQLFSGSLKLWLNTTLGVSYDQRNALIVGCAMGIAVIPTIFALTEDAIHGVPKYLSQASLALGATHWQTLTRIVLAAASPGIFAAVMIGLGRAVGETMIVLMATGNTPIMDWNPFQGMRTFAANIAVELPESEVGSTHYRILFLAALVLFLVTFALNTLAELVRQRLRQRYGNL